MKRSTLRRGWFGPVRVGATLEKQARDRVMASFDGRRERSSSARPRFPDSRRFRVEHPHDAFDFARSRGCCAAYGYEPDWDIPCHTVMAAEGQTIHSRGEYVTSRNPQWPRMTLATQAPA
jgi:hypothetical protein